MSQKLFALVVTSFLLYVASPLLLPVIMGGLLAILLFPALPWLEKKKIHRRPASGVLTLGITLLLLLPASLLIYFAAKAGFQQLQALKGAGGAQVDWASTLLEAPATRRIIRWITGWYPAAPGEISEAISDVAKGLSLRAAEVLGGLLARIPGMVLGLGVIIVSIYFFLVDGQGLVSYLRRHSFFGPLQTKKILQTLEWTCRSVLLASLVSGAAQALFEAAVLAVLGIPNVGLIAGLVFLASFVPVVGTAPVTIGVSIQQFLSGEPVRGAVLLGAALVVSGMDNVIRPWFLRGAVNLHPLLAFVAAFGGLQTLGFSGIFIGPVIAALFVATVQILLSAERR